MIKSFFSSFSWIFFISKRFASIDRKGKSAITGILAILGICFGVMSLITVVSVMNGFQMSFIDAILELSSYHVRVSSIDNSDLVEFYDFCESDNDILCISPFYESQGLIVGKKNKESAGIIRGVDKNICSIDKGFEKEIKIISGSFDLFSSEKIVLGSYLANSLGVRVGDEVNLLVLSGGKDVSLLSQDRKFIVSGIFECGYYDINLGYCFVNLEAAKQYFGENAIVTYGIKIKKPNEDTKVLSKIHNLFPKFDIKTWREYNRSFFGALHVEKNILMLVVFLIFVVVGINIYNSMRRLVFDRSQEISILSALGGTKKQIKFIFIMRGFLMGVIGAIIGVFLGILISLNIKSVFLGISHLMYAFQYLFTKIFSPENLIYVYENKMYSVYASIPARLVPFEVFLIAIFGILAPFFASLFASNNVLKMKIAEVLHYE